MLLRNYISINLNFLLYIRNLTMSAEEDVFPWLPIDKSNFLSPSEFDLRSQKLWNLILNSTDDENDDYTNWNDNKFKFCYLFRDDMDVQENLEIIKKCYFQWYKLNWKPLIELYSRQLVEIYYKILSDIENESHLKMTNPIITLSLVYDTLPDNWVWYNNNQIIISSTSDILNRKEIIERLKIMSFRVI